MTENFTETVELAVEPNGVQAAIDAGEAIAKPTLLDPGNHYVAVVPAGGRLAHVDLDLDKYRDTPRRKEGRVVVDDVASFVHYWGKHADEHSEVYANVSRSKVEAVLDAHADDGPRWGGHRLVLQLKHTQPWLAWNANEGIKFSQTDFAEFLEDNLADIYAPPAADMLEIAQTFQATTKVNFESGTRLASGQRKLTYVEQVDAKAGQKGELTIPESFTLGLQVFEGFEVADEVGARLRYRINGGNLQLSYHLNRPDEVARAAFDAIVNQLTEHLDGTPVLVGQPIG
ncbi:DUF2303 family protein [Tenggerimyces flavus]|uniref:DUF2303 family protein n=1 Tax=Tenggerimyces flavus TaxID=1708749 RepID=A0ABV7YBR1_9ACTN|nr:DUF2303 family protein [Tenggerimyces flavus]MBM7788888.1 uncharacterized protein YfdQ (DUF2303 family) [Tenggerimyces flavus]